MKTQEKIIKGKGYFIRVLKIRKNSFEMINFYELDKKKYPYLLDSVASGNKRARFSIVFYKPKITILKKNGNQINFLRKFDEAWRNEKINQEDFFCERKKFKLPFTGGWFLYLGYELVNEIEPSLKLPKSPFLFPTAFASRVKSAIIFDKIEENLYIFSEESEKEIEDIYTDFLKINLDKKYSYEKKKIEVILKGSDIQHQIDIKKCIDFIYQGEIFQANLSRLWEFKVDSDLKDHEIYRELCKTNPSPFSGLVSYKDSSIISSSPERLVSVKNRTVETRPIAGTRPRGQSGITDIELSRELMESEKERAEHLMLVDLERNDIARVCKAGSVKVNEMMVVESYSHVHHIVSNIKGILKEDKSPGDIIAAVFPGGTITGCPKIKCIEILGDLEKMGRGPYTGSFGYVNHDGNLDFNILIRSLVKERNKLSLRAGGGIVADSIPEKETQETEAKANAMLKALQNIRR